jgi:hypothetical protein
MPVLFYDPDARCATLNLPIHEGDDPLSGILDANIRRARTGLDAPGMTIAESESNELRGLTVAAAKNLVRGHAPVMRARLRPKNEVASPGKPKMLTQTCGM